MQSAANDLTPNRRPRRVESGFFCRLAPLAMNRLSGSRYTGADTGQAAPPTRDTRGLALRRRLAIDVGALVRQSRILEALRLCRQDNQAKRPCAASGDVQRAKP